MYLNDFELPFYLLDWFEYDKETRSCQLNLPNRSIPNSFTWFAALPLPTVGDVPGFDLDGPFNYQSLLECVEKCRGIKECDFVNGRLVGVTRYRCWLKAFKRLSESNRLGFPSLALSGGHDGLRGLVQSQNSEI